MPKLSLNSRERLERVVRTVERRDISRDLTEDKRRIPAQYRPGIFVRVQTDVELKPRQVVSVGTLLRDPNDSANSDDLGESPTFAATAPISGDRSPGITIEPIESGNQGKVLIAGIWWATVDILDASHQFCEVVSSDVTKFQSAATGDGPRIYAKPAGTGEKICAVLLCAAIDEPPPDPGPLGDPPEALGAYSRSAGDVVLDATDSSADTLQSIITVQWVFSLPSNETLILSGTYGSATSFVYDSRGTLDLTDVGTNITGNIETVSIDETAGSLTAPYTLTLVVEQTDGQRDTDSIVEGGALSSVSLALNITDVTLGP